MSDERKVNDKVHQVLNGIYFMYQMRGLGQMIVHCYSHVHFHCFAWTIGLQVEALLGTPRAWQLKCPQLSCSQQLLSCFHLVPFVHAWRAQVMDLICLAGTYTKGACLYSPHIIEMENVIKCNKKVMFLYFCLVQPSLK